MLQKCPLSCKCASNVAIVPWCCKSAIQRVANVPIDVADVPLNIAHLLSFFLTFFQSFFLLTFFLFFNFLLRIAVFFTFEGIFEIVSAVLDVGQMTLCLLTPRAVQY